MSEERKNNPKISVIVPIYKVEKYLDRCINSIVNQTYTNLEIILIDDGSPDNCPAMCDEWTKKDNRIKVIHKANGGLMAAWIDGVKSATSDYISFVDSDDWCELDMIEELFKPFKEFDVDMSICDYYESYDKKRTTYPSNKSNFVGLYNGEKLNQVKECTINRPNNDIPLYRWNKLYKKSTILNNLIYCDTRATISEDSCIVQASILDAKSIYFVNKNLYNYYFRPNSMIHSYNKVMNEKLSIYFDMFKQLYCDKVPNPEIGLTFERVRLANMLVKNILKSKEKNKKELLKEVCNLDIVKDIDTGLVKHTLKFRPKVLASAIKKQNLCWLRFLYVQQSIFIKFKKLKYKLKGRVKKYNGNENI